jgi:hypothetical protein
MFTPLRAMAGMTTAGYLGSGVVVPDGVTAIQPRQIRRSDPARPKEEGWTQFRARHGNSGVDLGARLDCGRFQLVCALEQLSGIRTEIVVPNVHAPYI